MVDKKSECSIFGASRPTEHSTPIAESRPLLGSRRDVRSVSAETSISSRPSKKTN